MLPASDLTEILTNLVALNLQPNNAAQVLAAVIPPLLRSSEPEKEKRAGGRGGPKPRRATRRKRKKSEPVANGAEPADAPRRRAIAALKAEPDATRTTIAEIASCSHSTAINARKDLAGEARTEHAAGCFWRRCWN